MLLLTRWFERAPSRLYGYLLLLPLATVPLTFGLALLVQTGPPSLHINPANGDYLSDPFWPRILAPGLLNLLPWLVLLLASQSSPRLRFHARLAGTLGALRLVAPIIVWTLAAPPVSMIDCPNLEPCGLNSLLWATGVSLALWVVTLFCWVIALARD
ncbi:MAG TPA: hypothetical protein VFU69_01435 [Ktedonobacterales bacterium]|nr:hypothetical protein [Ktedonobacterales bacterium]